jgi:hypothetical protein
MGRLWVLWAPLLGSAPSQSSSSALRSQAIQVVQYSLPVLGTKLSRVHGLLNIGLRLLQRHELLQLTFPAGLDALQPIQTVLQGLYLGAFGLYLRHNRRDTAGLPPQARCGQTDLQGCPTFAPAYVGRKRWAKPHHSLCPGSWLYPRHPSKGGIRKSHPSTFHNSRHNGKRICSLGA